MSADSASYIVFDMASVEDMGTRLSDAVAHITDRAVQVNKLIEVCASTKPGTPESTDRHIRQRVISECEEIHVVLDYMQGGILASKAVVDSIIKPVRENMRETASAHAIRAPAKSGVRTPWSK